MIKASCAAPGWRNWQTRWSQTPLPERACGFKSRSGHDVGLEDWEADGQADGEAGEGVEIESATVRDDRCGARPTRHPRHRFHPCPVDAVGSDRVASPPGRPGSGTLPGRRSGIAHGHCGRNGRRRRRLRPAGRHRVDPRDRRPLPGLRRTGVGRFHGADEDPDAGVPGTLCAVRPRRSDLDHPGPHRRPGGATTG